jgi:hypothetical protein
MTVKGNGLELKHTTPLPQRIADARERRKNREKGCANLFAAARALDERIEMELYPDSALHTKLSATTVDALMRVAAWLRKKGEELHDELQREDAERRAPDDVTGS